jgi:hypothetical protein
VSGPPPAIEWRDPPRSARKSVWSEILSPLLDRPGEWAMVRRYPAHGHASSAAYALRHGNIERPPGKWDFVPVHGELFARYIGPE